MCGQTRRKRGRKRRGRGGQEGWEGAEGRGKKRNIRVEERRRLGSRRERVKG